MTKQELAEKYIEDALLRGRWKLSERLPAERELAVELGVNRGTLRAALQTLTDKGILETVHGRGTTVQTLPQKCTALRCTLKASLEGLHLLLPPLMLSECFSATPLRILEMEHVLPQAGLALRGGDAKVFSWCQHRFFHLLVHCLENPCLLRAAENILPDTALLESAVRDFNLSQREEIFAALARILGELRRTDVRKAGESTAGYATLVLGFLEARPYRQRTGSGLSLSHVDSSGKQEKSCRTYKKF